MTGAVLRSRVWYNPDPKSRNFNVPAVMSAFFFSFPAILLSLSALRFRKRLS